MTGVACRGMLFVVCLVVISLPGIQSDLAVTAGDNVKINVGETAHIRFTITGSVTLERAQIWIRKYDHALIASLSDCLASGVGTCSLASPVAQSGKKKYGVTGDVHLGIQVEIFDVTKMDEGDYSLEISAHEGMGRGVVHVTVNESAHPGELDEIRIFDMKTGLTYHNQTFYTLDKKNYSLLCQILTFSKPTPNISWSPTSLMLDIQDQTSEERADFPGLMLVSIVAKLTSSYDLEDNNTFICSAWHFGKSRKLKVFVKIVVGEPPESPVHLSVLKSLTTTTSLFLTWTPGYCYGQNQTFMLTYCPKHALGNCMQITGIRRSWIKIGRLQPSTEYRFTLKSMTVFGYSDGRQLPTATKPARPSAMGVAGSYTTIYHYVEFVRTNDTQGSLPSGTCFKLLYFIPKSIVDDTDVTDCVPVDDRLPLDAEKVWQETGFIACLNGVCSDPSALKCDTIFRDNFVIIGLTCGGVFILTIIIIAVYCKYRKRAKKAMTVNGTESVGQSSEFDTSIFAIKPLHPGSGEDNIANKQESATSGDGMAVYTNYQAPRREPEAEIELTGSAVTDENDDFMSEDDDALPDPPDFLAIGFPSRSNLYETPIVP